MQSLTAAVLQWLNSPAFTTFGTPTSWAEVLGFTTGALCVYLVAIRNIWNWPVGIANNALWILLFVTAGLYADGILQIVYIALAIVGWYNWLHGGEGKSTLPVSHYTITLWVQTITVGIILLAFIFWILTTFTPSTVPFWDATTTTLSLLAVYGQIKKKLQSWFLWMLADLIYIPLYLHKGLTLTAILYTGFFSLCVYGYLNWRTELKNQNLTNPTPISTISTPKTRHITKKGIV